jgi:hypothetical protein
MTKPNPRCRIKLIDQRNTNSLTHLLNAKDITLKQKREMVRERNEYLFIFGDNLTPQGGRSYEDYIIHLYIGEQQ